MGSTLESFTDGLGQRVSPLIESFARAKPKVRPVLRRFSVRSFRPSSMDTQVYGFSFQPTDQIVGKKILLLLIYTRDIDFVQILEG